MSIDPPLFFARIVAGDPRQMHALTEAERVALGWLPCRHEGWRAIDERIETRSAPTASVVDGEPVVTWAYQFAPDCRAAMERAIDEQAEALRLQHITPGSGQAMVYQAKLEEARALTSLEGEPNPEDFPLLAASVGVDGGDIEAVAAAVLAMRVQWTALAAQIEHCRLHGKQAVRQAASDQEAHAAFCAVWGASPPEPD